MKLVLILVGMLLGISALGYFIGMAIGQPLIGGAGGFTVAALAVTAIAGVKGITDPHDNH